MKKDERKKNRQRSTGKISIRMLAVILPVLLAGMAVFTAISAISSKNIINTQTKQQMDSQLNNKSNQIKKEIDAAAAVANHLSKIVGINYQSEKLKNYEELLKKMIYEEEFIWGGGIWFAPNAFNKEERFVAPFAYKEGENARITYDYSNKKYDYFNQTFYQMVAKGNSELFFTPPYYDKTMDQIMVTCSVPINDLENRFIGCVSVVFTLETIQQLIKEMEFMETGTAFLVTGDGKYLYCGEKEKIMKEKVQEDANLTLAAAGEEMLAQENGITEVQIRNRSISCIIRLWISWDGKWGLPYRRLS